MRNCITFTCSDEDIIAEVKEQMSVDLEGPKEEDSDADGNEEEEMSTVKNARKRNRCAS